MQLVKHLRSSATQGNRKRAVSVVGGLGVGLFLLLAVVPFPNATRAKGIIKAEHASNVYAQTAGQLEQLIVQHGERVRAGQVIARFSSIDLEADIRLTHSAQVETQAQIRQTLHKGGEDLSALQEKADALELRRINLEEQLQLLEVRASQDGDWVAPSLHEHVGTWLTRGHVLGEVVDVSSLRFVAVIQQDQANIMFQKSFRKAELRLDGQSDTAVTLSQLSIIPFQSDKLPSTSMGWLGGGEIAVNTQEPSGTKALESFFLVQTNIPDEQHSGLTVLHGLSGTLRLQMAAQPLLSQAYRAIKQLLQKRYAL
jgi:putative peptide zinc metalloprotease protein